MFRRLLIAAVALSAVTGGAVSGTTMAGAATPSACVLNGTAHINPGLAVAARSFSYTFTGQFSNCKGSDPTIKSGTVSASGSGTGGCSKSNTNGSATITWSNGRTTSLTFKTTGAAAALLVQGKATGGEFAGLNAKALLVFQATPTQCNTAAGVTTAKFTGPSEIG
jgi:hypothetical protein